MKLNRTPNPLDRNARNGENDNWEKLEGSIKRIDDAVSDLVLESGGDSNLEVVQARGGKPVLNDRLNDIEEEITDNMSEVSSQLAETKQQIINETNQKLSLKRDKSVLIGLGDVGQDIIDGLNGGNNFSLLGTPRNESVSPIKTTFFNISSNLFNKNEIIEGYGIDASTGEPVVNATLNLSGFMPVKPSTHYIRSESNSTARWAFYKEDGSFISSTLDSPIIQTPNEAVLMRISLTVGFNLDVFRINEGTILLPYEDFYEYFDTSHIKNESLGNEKIKKGSITTDKLSFMKKSPNLLNKKMAVKGKGINSSTGEVIDNPLNYLFEGIEINEMENYIRSDGSIRVAFYRKDGSYISSTLDKNFQAPSGSTIAKVAVSIQAFEEVAHKLVLNEGTELVDEEFYEYIDPQYIKLGEESRKELTDVITPVPNVFYKTPEKPNAQGDSNSDFDFNLTKAQDVYDKYDELMSEFPNYITRKLLGNDQSGTLPIYQYNFNAERARYVGTSPDVRDYPKILLTCGVHGNSDTPIGDLTTGDPHMHIFSLYYFFEDLCKKWQTNEMIEYLRWNVNFSIIPIANPWGMNNHSRANSRNVDINRNMNYAWQEESNSHKGSSPFSEAESKIIRDFINESKGDDVVFHIDYHCIGGPEFVYDNNLIRRLVTPSSSLYNVSEESIKYISRNWIKSGIEFSTNQDADHYPIFGFTNITNPAPQVSQWVDKVANIPSITIEAFRQTRKQSQNGLGQFNSESIEMNVEDLANWIAIALRYSTT